MMAKNKTMKGIIQSEIAATNDAKNAENGFKNSMSSGTQGAGDSYYRNRK